MITALVLTGLTTGVLGTIIGMIIQQDTEKLNREVLRAKTQLANQLNGRLSRRIAALRRQNKTLRTRVDILTPSVEKEARKQFYVQKQQAVAVVRPTLPQ